MRTSMNNQLHISVVSHGQGELVHLLLQDIQKYCGGLALQLTLTLNIPEILSFDPTSFSFPVHILENSLPKGFGVNHNQAYRYGVEKYPCKYFCVINPDVRFKGDVFSPLISALQEPGSHGVIAPRVVNLTGELEDSVRALPTPFSILTKALGISSKNIYEQDEQRFFPDWVAGMFMLFPEEVFSAAGGFDEHFFLYYEDVDFCCRLRLLGYDVVVDPATVVMHDAQRASHRNLRYLRWHVSGAIRFFLSPVFAASLWRKWTGKS